LARAGAPLIDPMCGSGTLPIEAALIAADIAPGRGRRYFGFLGWRGHQPAVWARLHEEAANRAARDARRIPSICGYDANSAAIRTALTNSERAGLRGLLHFEKRALASCEPITARVVGDVQGLVVTNPPYGERVGDIETLAELYASLGDMLRRKFTRWTAYVLAGNTALSRHVGLRAARRHIVYNGAIECRLLVFPISPVAVRSATGPRWRERRG
jgi:23S rRNA (guanine2445-N2)-methyltransferase / 23S rRNA (guanine2069-N7)-methyltransferase